MVESQAISYSSTLDIAKLLPGVIGRARKVGELLLLVRFAQYLELITSNFFFFFWLISWYETSHHHFCLISLVISEDIHLFRCILAIQIFSFVNCHLISLFFYYTFDFSYWFVRIIYRFRILNWDNYNVEMMKMNADMFHCQSKVTQVVTIPINYT